MLSFNGTPVLNLQHLAEMVTACTDEQLRFDCEYSEVIIINSQAAAASTAGVLKSHSIPAAMSADLKQAVAVEWPPADVQQQEQQEANGSAGAAAGAAAAAAVVAAAAAAPAAEGGTSS